MAKKPFGWIRDAEEPVVPSPPRQTRAEKGEEGRLAQEVAKELVAVRKAEWPHLGLNDDVLEALVAFHDIPAATGGIAKKRQLARLGSLLLDVDVEALRAAMGSGRKGQTERQDRADGLERLRARIVAGGKEEEESFVANHPDTDRQRLRQLAGAARKAAGTEQEKTANRKLLRLLQEAAGVI
jgi:ribosome-associated protein